MMTVHLWKSSQVPSSWISALLLILFILFGLWSRPDTRAWLPSQAAVLSSDLLFPFPYSVHHRPTHRGKEFGIQMVIIEFWIYILAWVFHSLKSLWSFIFFPSFSLNQGAATYGSQAKSGLPRGFDSSFIGDIAMSIHLHIACDCFYATEAEWVVVTETVWPPKPEMFVFWFFTDRKSSLTLL